jgi:hypothetical protein
VRDSDAEKGLALSSTRSLPEIGKAAIPYVRFVSAGSEQIPTNSKLEKER